MRIIDNNLSDVEAAFVFFELKQRPMRELMDFGTGMDEEDFRQLQKIMRRAQMAKGRG